MRKINLLVALAMILLGTTLMNAQATRTWVSGVGDDANPCSRTAPCKTFAGAISKTAPGGEIDALDPGGFGALTITKSITIDGGGGQVASVLVAGTNGIVVAAGATDVVILRNLRFDGLRGAGNANAGLNGIRFISGALLNIESDVIFGFNNNCIDIALGQNAQVHVVNTLTKNCGGDGIRATTTSGLVTVGISHSQFLDSGNNGIEANDKSRFNVSDAMVQNATANGLLSIGDAQIMITHSDVNFSGNGIQAGTSNAANFVDDCQISFNGAAFAVAGGAGAANNLSYQTNRIANNGSDGPFQNASPGRR